MEWIRIEEQGNVFTEIMDLAHICIMRVFYWDSDTDKMGSVSITQIDATAGQYAIARVRREKKKQMQNQNQ